MDKCSKIIRIGLFKSVKLLKFQKVSSKIPCDIIVFQLLSKKRKTVRQPF